MAGSGEVPTAAGGGTRGQRLLRGWNRLVLRRPLLVVLLGLALSVILGAYAARNLGMSTNTENMIDDALPWRQDFIRFRNAFPERYRTIVVVVSADSQSLADRGARFLDERLDRMPEHFADSYAPTADEPLAGRELLLLDVAELEELTDDLAAAQPAFGFLRENYSLGGLFELLRRAATEQNDGSGSAPFFDRVAEVIDGTLAGRDTRMSWSALRSEDAVARRFVIVNPVLDPERPRPAGDAVEALRALGRDAELAFGERLSVALTGTVAMEDDEFLSVRRNASLTGLLALGSVMAILLLAFRSTRIFLASLVTLVAGLVSTAAFAAWSVGELNVISVAFAVLYIGLGIDFVIHYLLRVRELAGQGGDATTALESASTDVGGSLVICAVTTAVGFFSFIPTSFVGVSQLGLISGTGMFISLFVTLTLLPALMRVLFPHGIPVGASAAAWSPGLKLARVLEYRKTVLAIPLAAAIASLVALPQLRFEADPMLLRDPGTESVRLFRELSADPDNTPTTVSVLVPDEDDPDRVAAELAKLPSVQRVVSLATFAGKNTQQKYALLDDLKLLLGPSFSDYPRLGAVDGAEARRAIVELEAELESGGPAAVATDRFAASLAHLERRIGELDPPERQAMLDRLQRNLLSGLPDAMQLLAARLEPPALDPAAFPRAFVDRWRAPEGDHLLEVVPAVDTADPECASRFVEEVHSIAPRATGLPVVFERAGATVAEAFGQAFLYAAVVITLLLGYFLRSAADALLVLAPLLLAAIMTVGVMVAIDLPFNFANIIALPLLLGIGVDNGIHMIHRARMEGGAGAALLGSSTARAILFSGVTTLASFGNLALSSHLGMSSMGTLLGIGLGLILVVMLFVLPALIAWRIG